MEIFVNYFIPYKIVFNNDGEPIYILDTQELKSIFCNWRQLSH